MALSGDLATMGLEDIFQWLAVGKKIGVLELRGPLHTKRVAFHEGRITSVWSSDPREYLGQYLLAFNRITEEQLREALATQEDEQQLLGRILINRQLITEAEVRRIVQLKVEESIYDTFLWPVGSFEYHDGAASHQKSMLLSLDVTGIVLEGARRMDDWKRIRRVIQGGDAVLAPVPEAIAERLPLASEDADILARLDGQVRVDQLVLDIRMPEFKVNKLLFDLWEEAMEATPGSEYIHIGTDETYELGLGVECGCKARAAEVGRRGLMLDFVGRSARHMMGKGRKVMSWGGEYRPDQKIQPPKGLIVAEFSEKPDIARLSRDAGYPAWVYDPNPGIEHLFLPYMYRLRGVKETSTSLAASHRTLATAAKSGLFDGMICTSWDDSGLHNQVWMMRFVHAAEYSWSGGAPTPDEFIDTYFANYYGAKATNVKELWTLLNKGAYYYMDTFERKVWHWGEIGKTHLPDLPRGDAVEYSPYWNSRYKEMIERSRAQLAAMARVTEICRANSAAGVRHRYDFEIFDSIASLITHTAKTYVALSALENAITEAHRQHFVSNAASYAALPERRSKRWSTMRPAPSTTRASWATSSSTG